jgi:hypothetical protein
MAVFPTAIQGLKTVTHEFTSIGERFARVFISARTHAEAVAAAPAGESSGCGKRAIHTGVFNLHTTDGDKRYRTFLVEVPAEYNPSHAGCRRRIREWNFRISGWHHFPALRGGVGRYEERL